MNSSSHPFSGLSASCPDVCIQMEDDPVSRPPRPAQASGAAAHALSGGWAGSLADVASLRSFQDSVRWVEDAARDCPASEAQTLGLQTLRMREELNEARWIDDLDSLGDSDADFDSASGASGDFSVQIEEYFSDGSVASLPTDLQRAIGQATEGSALPRGPSGRLMALLAGIRHLGERMDASGAGRTALNFGHTTVRSLGSVALTTLARQAVGRGIDLALASGTSELTRTLIGVGAMGLPVLGQLALLWRDERQKDATPYSRATRAVLMGLCVGVGGAAVITGTLTNPGLRLAEVVLYPLLRDAVQARFPMLSDPDSGPTQRSLAASGTAYAVNQLGVSRVFAAAPDATSSGLLFPGLVARSLGNAAGESVDLMSLLYANHISRHGASTLPRLRIGAGDLAASVRTPLHWDTMSARGCFVSAFNQLYDTMLADHTLTRALRSVVGEEHAFTAADWLTELTAAALTVLTYPFWTDPVHARGFTLPTPPTLDEVRAMEEGRLRQGAGSASSEASAERRPRDPVQYAGNDAEPAVAADINEVNLVGFRLGLDRTPVTRL